MLRHGFIGWLALLSLWLCPVWCFADSLSLTDNVSVSIGHQIDFLEDPEGSLTIEQVVSGQVNQVESEGVTYTWKKAESEVPNFGYSTSIFWGRLVLDFSTGAANKQWFGNRSASVLNS